MRFISEFEIQNLSLSVNETSLRSSLQSILCESFIVHKNWLKNDVYNAAALCYPMI